MSPVLAQFQTAVDSTPACLFGECGEPERLSGHRKLLNFSRLNLVNFSSANVGAAIASGVNGLKRTYVACNITRPPFVRRRLSRILRCVYLDFKNRSLKLSGPGIVCGTRRKSTPHHISNRHTVESFLVEVEEGVALIRRYIGHAKIADFAAESDYPANEPTTRKHNVGKFSNLARFPRAQRRTPAIGPGNVDYQVCLQDQPGPDWHVGRANVLQQYQNLYRVTNRDSLLQRTG
jgi:hypothetical protein